LWNEIVETFATQTKGVYEYTIHELKHPSFKNVYYWLFFAYAFCFTLEIILPKQRKHGVISRKNFWLDTFYVFFNDIVIYVIGFFGLCAVTELIFLKILGQFGIHSLKLADITTWNPFVQVLIMFFIQDFMEYWAHYFLHRSDLLWTFHKIHHAQEELGSASTRHFHWVEMCIFKPLIYIPFAMIGYSVADYFLFQITVQNVWGFFTHMNVRVKWGFLNYIINTPETHVWHHAKNLPHRYGVNYASILNIWDLIFGHFYLPKDKRPILGVPDQKGIPNTFLAQLIYPFREIYKQRIASQKRVL
jgi:sterol desaturase/sphingolipid hydroxylase (fatty acid hydroxylase superfamily)